MQKEMKKEEGIRRKIAEFNRKMKEEEEKRSDDEEDELEELEG